MKTARGSLIAAAVLAALALFLSGCATRGEPSPAEAPATSQAKGPSPSEILAKRPPRNPPAFATPGDVNAFISWAGSSTLDEREAARKAIEGARQNAAVAEALVGEFEKAQKTDHSRALLILAILGEMRSPVGEKFLREFVIRPLPGTGTVVDGEILEQTAQAMLQAKAVDGLAYMRERGSDEVVLFVVLRHPSRIVRAEAISAFLWNQGDSPEARRAVLQYVRPGEEIFVDRVRRVQGEGAATFNRKLAEYLKAHPEALPPSPETFPPIRERFGQVPPKF